MFTPTNDLTALTKDRKRELLWWIKERRFGDAILELVFQAELEGIDAEDAFRNSFEDFLQHVETKETTKL